MQNYEKNLAKLKEENNFRTIKNIQQKIEKYIIVDNKKMLNLSSEKLEINKYQRIVA